MQKQVEKFGHVWTAKRTGYYQSTKEIDGKRRWLHQWTWQLENGLQSRGYEVHHKDHNKDNNDISNLELLTTEEHAEHHKREAWVLRSDENRKKNSEQLGSIRHLATEWHRSDEGREWHREHRIAMGGAPFVKNKQRTCSFCGTELMHWRPVGVVYCNRKCEYGAYRERHKNTIKNSSLHQ